MLVKIKGAARCCLGARHAASQAKRSQTVFSTTKRKINLLICAYNVPNFLRCFTAGHPAPELSYAVDAFNSLSPFSGYIITAPSQFIQPWPDIPGCWRLDRQVIASVSRCPACFWWLHSAAQGGKKNQWLRGSL